MILEIAVIPEKEQNFIKKKKTNTSRGARRGGFNSRSRTSLGTAKRRRNEEEKEEESLRRDISCVLNFIERIRPFSYTLETRRTWKVTWKIRV